MSEITIKILARIKRLIFSECCNYQSTGPGGINHSCWMRERSNRGVCIYFTPGQESPRCNYFEAAVLPRDRDLKIDLSADRSNQEIRKARGNGLKGRISHQNSLQV